MSFQVYRHNMEKKTAYTPADLKEFALLKRMHTRRSTVTYGGD